ncbi:DUF805 domain-containing protein [Actinoplanes sp. NPDC049265]|uniref:DUF805 domain-containing protein n=1 Tax=Actinoplanes sp. NPDC049265 TaxID=3363902 RepID=UPI003717B59F
MTRVSPIGYWLGCYRRYATFDGRARRAEYWWYTLFNVILYAVVLTLGFLLDYLTEGRGVAPGVVIFLYLAGTLLPTLAVTCRRLHDTGNSGWWQLLSIIPLASIVVFIFAVLPGHPGTNRYGPDPRAAY